jgi:hypothetical protein
MVGSLGHTTSSRRRLRVLALGVLIAASLVGSIGNAAAAQPELYREHLVAGSPVQTETSFAYTSVSCQGDTGTFAFEADGQATGPPGHPEAAAYPGTFAEQGTVTMVDGHLTGFHAEFTIFSDNGNVTGTKDLVTGTDFPRDQGFCQGAPAGRVAAKAAVTYTASTPHGVDHGCGYFWIDNTPDQFIVGPALATGEMVEQFDDPCVTGTVTDQSGAPFPQGTAGGAACPGPIAFPDCPGLVVAWADEDGNYTLARPLTPGQWAVGGFAFVDGQLLLSDPVTVTLMGNEVRELDFTVTVPATPPPGGGTFVIGTQNAVPGSTVTYWGSQWAKSNGGGPNASSFKGFATTSASGPTCGRGWASGPGNSSNPPATVPQYMAVVVTSAVNKAGSTLSGNTTKVVLVRTNPGYDGNPGHPGTATVVAVLCGG